MQFMPMTKKHTIMKRMSSGNNSTASMTEEASPFGDLSVILR